MNISKTIVIILTAACTLFGCAYHAEIVTLPDSPLYNQTALFNNVRYVPVLRYCDYYNLDWKWDLVAQRIEINKGTTTVTLRPGSAVALVNGRAIELDYPVEYSEGAAYLPSQSAVFISEEIFGLKEKPAPIGRLHEIQTVVIDPGHGGKDPGAVNRYGIREKDIVLDISRRLGKHLASNGIRVLFTREKDTFIPLQKRAAFANEKKADLFISIHANASKYSRAKGFEVYYLSEATDDGARALAAAENASLDLEKEMTRQNAASPHSSQTVWDLILSEHRRESRELAYYMCNITSDSLGLKKRGVKSARFVVLKGAIMPAVLVEVGFLTNRREGSQLNKGQYREDIAKAIARSVLAYKKEYDRTNGFTQ